MADVIEPLRPLFQRVEYPRDEPISLLNEQGHAYLPIYTFARTESVTDSHEECRLKNCLWLPKTGEIIMFIERAGDKREIQIMQNSMVEMFEKTDYRAEEPEIGVGKQIL